MILIIYGTRPEYLKVKPLIGKLKDKNINYKTLFTGQHETLISENADFNFKFSDLCDNRLNNILSNCLNFPGEWFEGITHVLVQGDTTSALGLALAAFHKKIKVIHLEAGLRSYDKENPYPEESNRLLISNLADIHLCPTEMNKNNLLKENINSNVYVVGNTGLDNLINYKNKCSYDNNILITLHRRENHNKIDKWFSVINDIASKYKGYNFILPLHPNPSVLKHKTILTNINIVSPLSHDELLNILVKTKLVITDSGGIQEECSFLNKKCLICRKTTERPESLEKTSFLIHDPNDLYENFEKHINNYNVNYDCPFGLGNSSELICNIIKDVL